MCWTKILNKRQFILTLNAFKKQFIMVVYCHIQRNSVFNQLKILFNDH